MTANKLEYTAPFFDMAKCYDMVPRQLACAMSEWLGIPARIITAWKSYFESLRI